MGDIASLNINGTMYGLKDEVARAGSGGGGSGYILKCFESGSVGSGNSVFISSDTGGCIYASGEYAGATSYSKLSTVKVDGISCDASSFASRQESNGLSLGSGISYAIPFYSNVNMYASGKNRSISYSVFKYVKLE